MATFHDSSPTSQRPSSRDPQEARDALVLSFLKIASTAADRALKRTRAADTRTHLRAALTGLAEAERLTRAAG